MSWTSRELRGPLLRAAKAFSAVILTGPRRAGKTALLRRTFPRASYHLLEAPDIIGRVRADPRGWLEGITTPAILDEVQNVPELFAYVRALIDAAPSKRGRWLLTGSQDFALMRGVTESMAGRAAILQLLPLSARELGTFNFLRGGFPEVWARPSSSSLWFDSYVQTFLERDVRALRAVKDLSTFRRFLSLLASRHGTMLNRTELAAPLGVSVPTISEWLSVLETTGQIALLPPYFKNFGKRLVKSPRVFWLDSGLVCHLLGITTQAQLEASPFIGAVFEGFLAAEILKGQVNAGQRRELYTFRDERGLEIDFVVPGAGGRLRLVAAKWTKTVLPSHALPLTRLDAGPNAERLVVYRAARSGARATTVAPGVRAQSVEEFLGISEPN